jgi:hypothetical protein
MDITTKKLSCQDAKICYYRCNDCTRNNEYGLLIPDKKNDTDSKLIRWAYSMGCVRKINGNDELFSIIRHKPYFYKGRKYDIKTISECYLTGKPTPESLGKQKI